MKNCEDTNTLYTPESDPRYQKNADSEFDSDQQRHTQSGMHN